jgi:histone H3/H4
MSIVVKAKIKEIAGTFNVAADFNDALAKRVEQMVRDAIERAKSNKRRTVMAKDI